MILHRVVGVSGSLRESSANVTFLRSLAACCPPHIAFTMYEELHLIPPFNVDLDHAPGAEVLGWKAFLAEADLIVLCSPEYAHGVSGVLKNALDWLVSDHSLMGRPVAFPNVSMRATIAQGHLEEVLRTMGFALVEACSPRASLDAPLLHGGDRDHDAGRDEAVSGRLVAFWTAVDRHLSAVKDGGA